MATRGTARRRGPARPTSPSSTFLADAVTKVILPEFKKRGKPFVLVFWSRDPDATQHNQGDSLGDLATGINGPTSRRAVQQRRRNPAPHPRRAGERSRAGRNDRSSSPPTTAFRPSAGATWTPRDTPRRARRQSGARPTSAPVICRPELRGDRRRRAPGDAAVRSRPDGDRPRRPLRATRRSAPKEHPSKGDGLIGPSCEANGSARGEGDRRGQWRDGPHLRSRRRRRADRGRGDVPCWDRTTSTRCSSTPPARCRARSACGTSTSRGAPVLAGAVDRRGVPKTFSRDPHDPLRTRSTSRTMTCSKGRGGTAASAGPT